MSFSGRTWGRLLGLCRRIVGVFRRFTRTRYTEWTSGVRGHRTCGVLLMLGGALLSLPFPGLPFSSTIPALMILCVCIADLEEDGAFLVVALGFLGLTLVYFAAILWGLLTAGDAAIDWVRGEL